ncbi:hypothetical protein H5T58_03525 [Candidatus Parcubacteria bacterium]|nr:hypothetical protein [Candidatus Parcubacteria bacterium]
MKEKFDLSLQESNYLKLVAVVSMVIDHIGAGFFPNLLILRIIGRIAFPLFCLQLTIGFRKTSNFKNYLMRIFFVGLFSQVPYSLFHGTLFPFNVFFNFLVGLLVLYFLEKKNYFLAFCSSLLSPIGEYSFYGTFLILGFYLFPSLLGMFFTLMLSGFFEFIFFNNFFYIFSIFSLLFCALPKAKISLPKSFFYLFYPLHLFFLYFLKILFYY